MYTLVFLSFFGGFIFILQNNNKSSTDFGKQIQATNTIGLDVRVYPILFIVQIHKTRFSMCVSLCHQQFNLQTVFYPFKFRAAASRPIVRHIVNVCVYVCERRWTHAVPIVTHAIRNNVEAEERRLSTASLPPCVHTYNTRLWEWVNQEWVNKHAKEREWAQIHMQWIGIA